MPQSVLKLRFDTSLTDALHERASAEGIPVGDLVGRYLNEGLTGLRVDRLRPGKRPGRSS